MEIRLRHACVFRTYDKILACRCDARGYIIANCGGLHQVKFVNMLQERPGVGDRSLPPQR